MGITDASTTGKSQPKPEVACNRAILTNGSVGVSLCRLGVLADARMVPGLNQMLLVVLFWVIGEGAGRKTRIKLDYHE